MTRDKDQRCDQAETIEPLQTDEAGQRSPRPWLTVLYHPDVDRIGDNCELFAAGRKRIPLSRLEPLFEGDQRTGRAPLETAYLSRNPHWLCPAGPDGVRLIIERDGSPIQVLPDRADLTRSFSAGELARGVVIQLANRVVLLLHLRDGPPDRDHDDMGLIGRSQAMHELRETIGRLACSDEPVLIQGESGVGKELVAQALHRTSTSAQRPLISINMAAIPDSTAAAELFGHGSGAFTGATRARRGYFEKASNGTLLLDEIGTASMEIQAMLLRVLETGEIQPVGDGVPRRVSTRVLAATDEDLEQAMRAGRFRSSLYYRLAANSLWISPLRERIEDVSRLLVHFLRQDLHGLGREDRLAPPNGPEPAWLGAGLVARLACHHWPGNVRQLRHISRQMATHFAASERIDSGRILEQLPELTDEEETDSVARMPSAGKAPSEIGDQELLEALRANRFQVRQTATALGISRTSLYSLMEKSPLVRRASDIPADELNACLAECDDDVDLAAEKLEVSAQGLKRWLTKHRPA